MNMSYDNIRHPAYGRRVMQNEPPRVDISRDYLDNRARVSIEMDLRYMVESSVEMIQREIHRNIEGQVRKIVAEKVAERLMARMGKEFEDRMISQVASWQKEWKDNELQGIMEKRGAANLCIQEGSEARVPTGRVLGDYEPVPYPGERVVPGELPPFSYLNWLHGVRGENISSTDGTYVPSRP